MSMLTARECLQMEVFTGAVVVAGEAGLDRQVGWVHVAGVPDAPTWLNGGEFVLTTPYTLPESAAEQRAYVQAMVSAGAAALAVAVGRYSEETPAVMRQAADAAAFPLIEIPYQTRFVDIARAVNERIAESAITTTRRALEINRRLTERVLDGGDLKDLAATLAGLIHHSISIENERFEILASHNIAAVDEARRYTLSQGRTDPRLVAALEARGALAELRHTRRPVRLPQMPEVGLEMERILAPIIVHGEVYGYVWIIADDRPLEDLDLLAIESGATIAALMMLYQETAQNAESSLKGGLLAQLIQGEAPRDPGRAAALVDQALRYGVSLAGPWRALVIEGEGGQDAQGQARLLRRINRLTAGGWHAVAGLFAGHAVILTNAASAEPLAEAVCALSEDDALGLLRIAISGPGFGGAGVSAAYQQCQEALLIGARLADRRAIIAFESLGYLHTLYSAGPAALAANPYIPPLLRLRDESGADLFETLEAYVDGGGNGVQTAEALMIHRSTLNYRLSRIHDLCRFDLSSAEVRTNVQIAIKLLRLFGEDSTG
jgi:purine catabolism regulator